jgi:uncharacterized membrane protein
VAGLREVSLVTGCYDRASRSTRRNSSVTSGVAHREFCCCTRLSLVVDLKPQTEYQTTTMSNLIVLGFNNEADAFEMRAALARLQTQYLIEMEDAVVVTRDAQGKVKLHQPVNLTAAGALSGTFWGSLIGLLFLNPLLGAAVGAGSGAISGALTDIGINDQFMKNLGATLTPGTSALFVLVRKAAPDKVLDALRPFIGKAKVLQSSLTKDKEEELRRALEGVSQASSGT